MVLSPNERTELRRITAILNWISSEKIAISKTIRRSDFRRLKNMKNGFTSEIIVAPDVAAKRSRLPAKQRPCSCRVDDDNDDHHHKCLAPECAHYGGEYPAYDRDGCLSEDYCTRSALRFIHECTSRCACHPAACLNRVVQRGTSVPKELCSIRGKGLGVRTLAFVKKGQLVGTYCGRLCDADVPDANEDPSHESNRYLFEVDDERGNVLYNIDSYKEGNVTRFLNHHCKPNLRVEFVYGKYSDLGIAEVAFFAKVDIPSKRELCFSYGSEYLKRVQMLCKCSSRTHIFEPVHQEYRFAVDGGDGTATSPKDIYPVQVIRSVVLVDVPGGVDNVTAYEVRLPGLEELRRVLVAPDGIQPFTSQLLLKFREYATKMGGEHEIAMDEIDGVLRRMDPRPPEEQWKLSNLELPEVRVDYEQALRTFCLWKPSLYFTERNVFQSAEQRRLQWKRRKVSGIENLRFRSSFETLRVAKLTPSAEKWKRNLLRPPKSLRPGKKKS